MTSFLTIITGFFFVIGLGTGFFTLYVQGQYILGKISASLWVRTTINALILLLATCAVLCILLTVQVQDIIPLS